MDHDAKLKMVSAMRRYDGGFVIALSECFVRADSNNLNRLYLAFPEYVDKYLTMAGEDEIKFTRKEVVLNESKSAEETTD